MAVITKLILEKIRKQINYKCCKSVLEINTFARFPGLTTVYSHYKPEALTKVFISEKINNIRFTIFMITRVCIFSLKI